ncbi:hypothetical protein Tco_1304729 [Tanacetum coccineum]
MSSTTPLCDPSSARVMCVASASRKPPADPCRWTATKLLSRCLCTLPRPQVLKLVAIRHQCTLPWSSSYASVPSRTSSSSAVAGAGEATDKGITGETDGDFGDHSGDVGVPTDDGAGEALTGERTRGMSHLMFLHMTQNPVPPRKYWAQCPWLAQGHGVWLPFSSSFDSVSSSSDSVLYVYVSAIGLEVPLYLFRRGRVSDDAWDDDDEGVS